MRAYEHNPAARSSCADAACFAFCFAGDATAEPDAATNIVVQNRYHAKPRTPCPAPRSVAWDRARPSRLGALHLGWWVVSGVAQGTMGVVCLSVREHACVARGTMGLVCLSVREHARVRACKSRWPSSDLYSTEGVWVWLAMVPVVWWSDGLVWLAMVV